MDFPYIKQFSDTSWVSYNSVQIWHYLSRVSVISHRFRAQSHKTIPTSDINHKFLIVTCTSDQPVKNQDSHDPLLGFDNLLEWLTELKETLIYIYQFIIKDILKDMSEKPDENICRVRSQEVTCIEAFVPMKLGYSTLPGCRCVDQPRSSSNHILWGFLWRLQHIVRVNH